MLVLLYPLTRSLSQLVEWGHMDSPFSAACLNQFNHFPALKVYRSTKHLNSRQPLTWETNEKKKKKIATSRTLDTREAIHELNLVTINVPWHPFCSLWQHQLLIRINQESAKINLRELSFVDFRIYKI